MISISNPIDVVIQNEFRTVDDVIHALSRLERIFCDRRDQRDRRGIFITACVTITHALMQRSAEVHFGDHALSLSEPEVTRHEHSA